jgi:hypothetical protein
LPFVEGQFSLAVVSHLLFLYSEQLDLDHLTRAGFVVEVLAVE